MRFKEKLLNKTADFLYKYKTDTITSCNIKGLKKSAIITLHGDYIKEIDTKQFDGLIDVNELLMEEIDKNDMQKIMLCENGKVLCITDQKGAIYEETSHEFFDLVNETVYVLCSKESYNLVKEYLQQSTKWKQYLTIADDIPFKNAFEKTFNVGYKKKETSTIEEDKNKLNDEKKIDIKSFNNTIIIDGIISSVGKTFYRKDNTQAKYIDIVQEDSYKGQSKKYNVKVSLEDSMLEQYGHKIEHGDNVSITGKLVSYVGKDQTPQTIIKCSDILFLNRNIDNKQVRDER